MLKKNKKKAEKPTKKVKKTRMKVPRTVQQTIPYYCVYPDEEIIEISPGKYTRAYELKDINYQIAKQAEQEDMFIKYGEFINAFDSSVDIQIVINNRSIDREFFEEETLLKYREDNLDELREEMNTLLKKKIREGQNNLIKEKYLIVAVEAKDIHESVATLNRLESQIIANIKKIGSSNARPLSIVERLAQLHDIYNPESIGKFGNKVCSDVRKIDGFDFKHMRKLGLTTKDCIAPPKFEFRSGYGMIGETYFESLYLDNLPTALSDNVLAELTNTEFKMLTSVNIYPVPMEKAQKLVKAQIVNINANMIERQKSASRSGYSVDLISPELRETQEEAIDLMRSLSAQNQKMYMISLIITHFADSREELKSNSESIRATARRLLCSMKPLLGQQENGLNASLPLCNNKIEIKRTLTTDSTAVFMPFVNQELNDRNGGIYYGNNAVSKNLIMFNRRNSKNGNGFILGTPGSGKSMSAKQEMLNILLATDDQVIVIDPEGEYYPMAELLEGEVIRIAPGSDAHINPLDMNRNYSGNDDDPITLKSDFMISIFDVLIGGGRYELSPGQRSIIDRCTRGVYKRYYESIDRNTGKPNREFVPTLKDFYNELRKQQGYDAVELATALEIYAVGSQNIFSEKTNVDCNNRFTVFDIKDVGTSLKTLALLVVLDNVWNQIVDGRNKGRHVWFYIDEIYLLFKSDSSAEFLRTLYKRARKYGGIPTGITQNVDDILQHDIARTMLSNSEFIQMLNQAPLDRNQLAQLLNISPSQLYYITNSSPGEGLIYTGASIIPFKNQLPKDTKMYEAMTTKLEEVKAIQRKSLENERRG